VENNIIDNKYTISYVLLTFELYPQN